MGSLLVWRLVMGSCWGWIGSGRSGCCPVAKGTRWDLNPGGAERLPAHRTGQANGACTDIGLAPAALAELLGRDFWLGCKDNLYRCLISCWSISGSSWTSAATLGVDLFAAMVRGAAL